jgi:RNA polymerase sigma-70 factor, ECF subfamily
MTRGDEDAYCEFFAGYFDRLVRYLLVVSRGQEDAAREAVQFTLARVVRNVRPFDSEEAFWCWLTLLARSAWIDQQRKYGRYQGFLERFRQRQQEESSIVPDHQADGRLRGLLEAQLRQLPEDERTLIQRKYLDGQATMDIARQCGRTEKAVESHLVRIRRKLKEQILSQLNHEPI